MCVRSKKQQDRIVCCKFHHSNVYQAFRQINLGHDKNIPKRIAIQKDLVHEISGGLPYTIRVMVELEKALKHQDMQELGIHIVELLLLLKQLDIKENDLWVLYKEICGKDAGGVIRLALACEEGVLEPKVLREAIHNAGTGTKFDSVKFLDELYERMRTRFSEPNKVITDE